MMWRPFLPTLILLLVCVTSASCTATVTSETAIKDFASGVINSITDNAAKASDSVKAATCGNEGHDSAHEAATLGAKIEEAASGVSDGAGSAMKAAQGKLDDTRDAAAATLDATASLVSDSIKKARDAIVG